ncbi:hypothetical protein [Rhodobacter sp. NSM]|uniref:hypothetical protein n=1 Tax=Rhodobacter sp. NSM TaxID=3457501 RepID=UPI003FD189FA
MILVWWHLAGRFYEARSIRALSNHLRWKAKSGKYFSLIDNAQEQRGDDAPEFDRILPSGWWLLPSVIVGTGVLVIVLWSVVSAVLGLVTA